MGDTAKDSWDALTVCLESFLAAWEAALAERGEAPPDAATQVAPDGEPSTDQPQSAATMPPQPLPERLESGDETWIDKPRGPAASPIAAPEIESFVPDATPDIQRQALSELIKVDIEYRLQFPSLWLDIEHYVARFPELDDGQGPPADLIFDEYHLRRMAGREVTLDEYLVRFPDRAAELRKLAGVETVQATRRMKESRRADPLPLHGMIDEFELQRKLGSGAFADVYLARQRSMDRTVALKVSQAGGTHESRTLAQLDHPNIIRVFDQRWIPDQGLRLVYMEYAPGGTLRDVIRRVRETPVDQRSGATLLDAIDMTLAAQETAPPRSSRRERLARQSWHDSVCELGSQLAEALSYADSKGILHRDVKPANILLNADGAPKLADFNIAYAGAGAGEAPAAYFGGTPAYMSPEQLEALDPRRLRDPDELDCRSDIFSLGAVLWELLSGQRPFADIASGSNWRSALAELVEQRGAAAPPDSDDVPEPLRTVLLKCLASRREERYSHPDQLRRDLDVLRSPELRQLLHPPPGSWQRFVVRLPLLALAVAVLIPNIGVSALNLFYNISKIVAAMSEAEKQGFYGSLTVVNLIAWGGSTAVCIAVVWPILTGLAALQRDEPPDDARAAAVLQRGLALGWLVALTVGATWTCTGLAFPLVAGSASTSTYLHFLVSQALHGLLVAGLCFFFVMFLTVRAVCPRFVHPQSHESAEKITNWKQRVGWFSTALALAPLLAIAALGMTGAEQYYFIVLAVVGAVVFLVSLGMKPLIQADLDRLARAVENQPEDSATDAGR